MPRRPPLLPESLSADSKQFYALLNEAQDVSMMVVAVSYIDACLASLLAKRLLKSPVTDELLDSRTGALGSFAARSRLAYVLALIEKSMYQDLQILAELRNDVAHNHFALSFTDPIVVERCERLKYVSAGRPILDEGLLTNPRNRFMFTAVMIANRLLITALETTHAKRLA